MTVLTDPAEAVKGIQGSGLAAPVPVRTASRQSRLLRVIPRAAAGGSHGAAVEHSTWKSVGAAAGPSLDCRQWAFSCERLGYVA